MATDPTTPLGAGAELRELLRLLRDDRWLVYSEGGDHLAVQPCAVKPRPVHEGLRKHKELFVCLLKDDSEMDAQDQQRILDADPRMGFQAPGDWAGAAARLRELGGLEC